MKNKRVLLIGSIVALVAAAVAVAVLIFVNRDTSGFTASDMPSASSISKIECNATDGDVETTLFTSYSLTDSDKIAEFMDNFESLDVIKAEESISAVPEASDYTLFTIYTDDDDIDIVVYKNYMSIDGTLYETTDGSEFDLTTLRKDFSETEPDIVETTTNDSSSTTTASSSESE